MDRLMKSAACSICLILFLNNTSFAKGWRGIVPLRSTRKDIARLYKQLTDASLFGIGLPQDTFNIVGEGMVNIQYSHGGCVEGWNVRRDTVVSITVNLTEPIPFEDMRAKLEHLPKDEDDAGAITYADKKAGIYYGVQDGRVLSITFGPDERERKKTCQRATRR